MQEVCKGSVCNEQIDYTRFDGFITSSIPSYLSEESITDRAGSRPKTLHCLPHSQLSQNPSENIWQELRKRLFSSIPNVKKERSLVSVPGAEALWLKEDAKGYNFMIGREFAHLHPLADGSMHLILSPKDARLVVKKGWGEYHLLAGQQMPQFDLPKGLIMVYAPRTLEEVDTVMKIVKASYDFTTNPA